MGKSAHGEQMLGPDNAILVKRQTAIDQLADRFEQEFLDGSKPCIEDDGSLKASELSSRSLAWSWHAWAHSSDVYPARKKSPHQIIWNASRIRVGFGAKKGITIVEGSSKWTWSNHC